MGAIPTGSAREQYLRCRKEVISTRGPLRYRGGPLRVRANHPVEDSSIGCGGPQAIGAMWSTKLRGRAEYEVGAIPDWEQNGPRRMGRGGIGEKLT